MRFLPPKIHFLGEVWRMRPIAWVFDMCECDSLGLFSNCYFTISDRLGGKACEC